MNNSDGGNNRFTSPDGFEYELAGWRVEGGEWHDIEAGDRLPEKDELIEIDLVTVNLQPDSDNGFYRSADIFMGFDENYTIGDLVDELSDLYGFAR